MVRYSETSTNVAARAIALNRSMLRDIPVLASAADLPLDCLHKPVGSCPEGQMVREQDEIAFIDGQRHRSLPPHLNRSGVLPGALSIDLENSDGRRVRPRQCAGQSACH